MSEFVGVFYSEQSAQIAYAVPVNSLRVAMQNALLEELDSLSCPELLEFTQRPQYYRDEFGLIAPPNSTYNAFAENFDSFELTWSGQRAAAHAADVVGMVLYQDDDPTGHSLGGSNTALISLRDSDNRRLGDYRVGYSIRVTSAKKVSENFPVRWEVTGTEWGCTISRDSGAPLKSVVILGKRGVLLGLLGDGANHVIFTPISDYPVTVKFRALSFFSSNFVLDNRPECFVSPRLTFRFGFARPGPGILEEATPESPMLKDCLGVLCNYTGSIEGE